MLSGRLVAESSNRLGRPLKFALFIHRLFWRAHENQDSGLPICRKLDRHYDKRPCRRRHCIERCFGRLKDFRRTAIRLEHNVKSFVATFCLAAVVI